MKLKLDHDDLVAHCEGPQPGMRGFFGFVRGDYTGSDFFEALRYYGPTSDNEAVKRSYRQLVDLESDVQKQIP